MRTRFLLCSFVVSSAALHGCGKVETARGQEKPAGGAAQRTELVVYSGDFAMVNETREVDLAEGRSQIGIQRVSKLLDHDSVLYSWPKTKDAKIVSSTYDLGMHQSTALLKRYLGREVDLVYRSEGGKESERKRGTLEIADQGYETPHVVVRVGDSYVVDPAATIEAPADGDVVTIPQLSAVVECPRPQRTPLALSYLTTGLSWNADYSLTLRPDSDSLALECWATVTNKTGIDFVDADLSFVAGSPNRAARSTANETASAYSMMESDEAKMPMRMNARFGAPERMGELYAYPYRAKANIRQDQQNRVRMMGSEAVSILRDYAIVLPTLYMGQVYINADKRLAAVLALQFYNSEEAGLGQPLPGGAVRVYEPGPNGTPRYIGAATITDTPKDAKVYITLTNVFDLYAIGKVVETKQLDRRRRSTTVEVAIHNEKNAQTQVRLVQSFSGNWSIVTETDKHKKSTASSVEWKLDIPAGAEKTLRYTVVTTS